MNMCDLKLFKVSLTAVLTVGIVSFSLSQEKNTSNHIWPGESWATSTPEAEGVSSEVIQGIVKDIEAGAYGAVDQFLLIRNGKAIADYTFNIDYDALVKAAGDNHPHPIVATGDHQYNIDHTNWHPYFNGTNLHTLQSASKSITSAALGIAIDEGFIKNVDVPIAPFFKGYQYDLSDPRKAVITLEDLLTMRSGIKQSTVFLESSDQWIQFVLDQPMDKTPGTVFEYNDGVNFLIGKIIRQATGQRVDEWAKTRLFEPIGIKNFYWKTTPDGETDTQGGLYLSTHDLARIGYLFLREGEWDGKQILSKDWVKASVTPIVEDTGFGSMGYGYQWWVPGFGEGKPVIFAGLGMGGQYVMVAPEYDIVVVFNGWNLHKKGDKSTLRVLKDVIIPSLN